jgi:hypothetical protein
MGALREAVEQELKLRGYSPRTRKTYLGYMERFVRYFMQDPRQLNETHLRGYLVHLIEQKKVSQAYHISISKQ